MAEKYSGISAYAYCLNNPINLIDPDGKEVKNGHKEQRDAALKSKEAKQADFDAKYTSRDLERDDFESGKEFRKYKNERKGLEESESNFKKIDKYYQRTEKAIATFRSTDSENFTKVDNLKNNFTGDKIDVIVKFGYVDPKFGGAVTDYKHPWHYDNQKLLGDGNIHITFDGTSKFSDGITLAHEFGHAYGISQQPYWSFASFYTAYMSGNANCQHPNNRHETFAETAMDWQERFINLLSEKK